MGKPKTWKKRWLHTLYCSISLLVIAGFLLLLAHRSAGFAEWYAVHVFPLFRYTLGNVVSLFPFSLYELMLALLVLLLLFLVGYTLVLARQTSARQQLKLLWGRILRIACVFVSTVFLLYVLTCGIQYTRTTFAEQAGLQLELSTEGELLQLYRLLNKEVEKVLLERAIAAEGSPPLNRVTLHQQTRAAMAGLQESYPQLPSSYPQPKAMFFSRVMSYLHLGGIYAAPLMEANYNREMPPYNQPFTICHELAHLAGYAREDEANFIGYLACIGAESPHLQYSGLFYALSYVTNALAKELTAKDYSLVYTELPRQLQADFWESSSFWQRYSGLASQVSSAANDRYLRANHQDDGVQSYGRMVDLLLAYYHEALPQYSPHVEEPEPEYTLPVIALADDDLYSRSALLLEVESGSILYAKNTSEQLQPASVTKVLAAITAIEMLAAEDLEKTVTLTTRDFSGLHEAGASLSGFAVGEEVRYLDLLYTLMLVSGCDSANALANNLCGSLTAFAERMNAKLASLGLSDSHFENPSGLPDARQYTTAADMAVVFADAMQNPLFREIVGTSHYAIPPTNVQPEGRRINSYLYYRINHDFAGARLPNGAQVLGGKTGYTKVAGLCLAIMAEVRGREYIAIVLGGPGNNRSEQFNFMDAIRLFEEI